MKTNSKPSEHRFALKLSSNAKNELRRGINRSYATHEMIFLHSSLTDCLCCHSTSREMAV